jgi:hypothetical protein
LVPVRQRENLSNGQVTVETLRNRAGRYGLVVRSWRDSYWFHSAVSKRMVSPRDGLSFQEALEWIRTY